jgi:lipoprotein-anchoring transpeptidase ErfK/SrfK
MTLVLAFLLLFQPKAAAGQLWMAASTEKKILVVRQGATDVKQFNIAVGSKGHPTPTGRFTVKHLIWNPAWVPPDEKWAKGKKPTAPGDPKNPMRAVKIFFQEPDYYIHGTDREDSIGYAASHGCIRISEADAVELARYLMEQTVVKHSDDWYSSVVASGKPTDVKLPAGVTFVIGR